jgi:hypothetical protein
MQPVDDQIDLVPGAGHLLHLDMASSLETDGVTAQFFADKKVKTANKVAVDPR